MSNLDLKPGVSKANVNNLQVSISQLASSSSPKVTFAEKDLIKSNTKESISDLLKESYANVVKVALKEKPRKKLAISFKSVENILKDDASHHPQGFVESTEVDEPETIEVPDKNQLLALGIPPEILTSMHHLLSENTSDTSLKYGPLIGAIDEGTSSTRFLVFASKTAEVLTYHQVSVPFIVPQEGWFEQDPMVILEAVRETIKVTCDNLEKLNIRVSDITAVGITNQRETTVLWDRYTGKPLHNAIVWMDTRTHTTVDEILKYGMRSQYFLQNICGLPVSTYFSALKVKWLMDNVPNVKEAMDENRCLFGTIDTWIIWNLTGGVKGGVHVTDVTNASRTMLMNIETLNWDQKLCDVFNIPIDILPDIRSSSEIYACMMWEPLLEGVPIAGILGDQQAALVGEMCFKNGQAKCTYGTGCFILYNTGQNKVISSHGLLTTVAYQFGPKTKPFYALEGSVAIAGIGLRWLRDNLEILEDVSESGEMAASVGTEGEVIFVPAFSGLYAPYWRQDARSVICGVTEETKPGHFIKAALEAVCFQVRDVLEAMTLDCGSSLNKLLVDGGMVANDYLMQMQSDYCGIPVVRPTMAESTSLGAAIAAGIAEGIEVWEVDKILPVPCDTFHPQISEDIRNVKYSKWKMGIERSMGWIKTGGIVNDINLPKMIEWDETNTEEKIAAATPAGLFLIGAAAIVVLAEILRRNTRLFKFKKLQGLIMWPYVRMVNRNLA